MTAENVFQRYEEKYLMDKEIRDLLIPEIKKQMNVDEYCRRGRSYRVWNLYYDTPGDDVIRNSLEKPFYKEKIRMRSYGKPRTDKVEVFLEIKKKIDGIVAKRRAVLPYGDAKAFMAESRFPETDEYMTRQVLREIEYYLSCNPVQPSTAICYERKAFFGKEDRAFRLTFDDKMRYRKLDQDLYGDSRKKTWGFPDMNKAIPLLPDHLCLMEVKVSNALPLWVVRLLHREGVYSVSFSKFGVSYKIELMKRLHLDSENITILSHI